MEGCNSCHEALNHAYVVIKAPDQAFFANQDFRSRNDEQRVSRSLVLHHRHVHVSSIGTSTIGTHARQTVSTSNSLVRTVIGRPRGGALLIGGREVHSASDRPPVKR